MNDPINHPTHYTSHPSGVEPITITKHMNFCLGNVIKYVMRADYKGNRLDDLKKAQYYLNLEIETEKSKIKFMHMPYSSKEEFKKTWPDVPDGDINITQYLNMAPKNREEKERREDLLDSLINNQPQAEMTMRILREAGEEGERNAKAFRELNDSIPNIDIITWKGSFPPTEEEIKEYMEYKKQKADYKDRINAQYKPEVWSNQKAIKDGSDPSGEPFLTDLCKVIESEESKNV